MRVAAVLALTSQIGCDKLFDLEYVEPIVAIDAPVDRDALVTDGLIAWYPMDDTTGMTAVDATGGGHDALCTGAECPVVMRGVIGDAMFFDGNDHLVVSPTDAFNTLTGYTVAAWVRFFFPAPPGTVWCPLSKGFGMTPSNAWQLCLNTSYELLYYIHGSQPLMAAYDVAGWHHVAMSWSGSVRSLWVDGVEVDSEVTFQASFDDDTVRFGCDIDDGSTIACFAGGLDDVRIYNRALDATELATLVAEATTRD